MFKDNMNNKSMIEIKEDDKSSASKEAINLLKREEGPS